MIYIYIIRITFNRNDYYVYTSIMRVIYFITYSSMSKLFILIFIINRAKGPYLFTSYQFFTYIIVPSLPIEYFVVYMGGLHKG